MTKKKAIYIQLMDRIKEQLNHGELQVGDRLPSERWYSTHYQMNRMTVRNALKHLEEEGILFSKQGSGYYVKDTSSSRDEIELGRAEILSLSAQLRQKRMPVTRRMISLKKIKNDALKQFFPEEKALYEIIRLSSIKKEAYVLQKAYIPASIFEDADRFDFETFSLYAYMEDKGHRPKQMVSNLQVQICPMDVEEWMNLEYKMVFQFEDLGYDVNHELVEYTLSYYNPKCTTLHYVTKGIKMHKG